MPNVLITGAAKRVGAVLAKRFSQEGFGVAIHYNSSTKEALNLKEQLLELETSCEIFQGNLSYKEDVEQVFANVKDHFGQIDVCINNASLFQNDDIFELDENLIDAHLAINLKAPLYLSALVASQKLQDDSLIINMLDNSVRWH
jgi:NAD(P)-dependent dehydrogenase (short-subunit alcohol dehydrogenase family)